MNYKLCSLYGIKSTKKLCELLGIENPSSFSIKKTPLSVKPKIDYMKSPKGRLVEAPSKELKTIQRRLLKKLQKLDIPSYAFCGVKGKTVVDNASMHEGKKYIYQTDLSKFFPHVTRDKVYRFFINKMKFSPDAARLITDICTIDYKYVDKVKYEEVFQYMQRVGVKPNAHIMTGSPASCILSYLVNEDMFNVFNSKCEKQGMTMTIYIDDITFSCFSKINSDFINYVNKTLVKFRYKISMDKCKLSCPSRVKKITGIMLDKNGNIKVPNTMKNNIHAALKKFKEQQAVDILKLCGYLSFASIVEPKYDSVRKVVVASQQKDKKTE